MRFNFSKVFIYTIFGFLVLITLIPLIIMLANAGRTQMEIATSISLLPSGHYQENYAMLSEMFNVKRSLFNSMVIATSATLLTVYFSGLVAYGFSVYEFKYKEALFLFLLATMMIPSQLSFIGFVDLVKKVGLMNSYIPLILPAIASAGTVYFLRQYALQAIDRGVIESARMDGGGEFKIYHKIIMPIMQPAMATMAIFTFIYHWNSYLMPLLIIQDQEKYPLPLAIRYISTVQPQNAAGLNLDGMTYLIITISVIPLLIIFLIFSKKIVNGLSTGSMK